jgi:hypothetical protein
VDKTHEGLLRLRQRVPFLFVQVREHLINELRSDYEKQMYDDNKNKIVGALCIRLEAHLFPGTSLQDQQVRSEAGKPCNKTKRTRMKICTKQFTKGALVSQRVPEGLCTFLVLASSLPKESCRDVFAAFVCWQKDLPSDNPLVFPLCTVMGSFLSRQTSLFLFAV